MKKELNYNYAFLFYDVGEKRVQKVFKICKKYLSHIQNSVFEGEISKVQLVKLQQELKVYIDSNLDSVILFKQALFYKTVDARQGKKCGTSIIV